MNKDILKELEKRDDELEFEIPEGRSGNACNIKAHLQHWDSSEPFPYIELKRYIRMNEWTKNDFNIELEMLLMDKLPSFIHDIYFEMKEFKANTRMEPLPSQRAFGRVMGYPMDTQEEKAFVVFDWSFKNYYENSELHQGE